MDWVLELKNKSFTILRELTNKEKMSIESASNLLHSLEYEISFFEEINDSYDEYIGWFDHKREIRDNDIVRLINNYLFNYKRFIDGWETYLKREKDERMLSFYEKSLSGIYDTNFEYRFIYNLRNYAQHCGHPVSSIRCSLNNKPMILLNRKDFLENHNGMQSKFRKELEASNLTEIDVDEAIRIVHLLLTELHNKLINQILNSADDEFLRASISIVEFYNNHNQYGGELVLTDSLAVEEIRKMSITPGEAKIQMFHIPHVLAEKLIKESLIKFKFKGRKIGCSSHFPIQFKPSLPVQMPQFKTGGKFVKNRGIVWARVIAIKGFKYEDGYDRYFAIYAPDGLSYNDYEDIKKKFESEIDSFFS